MPTTDNPIYYPYLSMPTVPKQWTETKEQRLKRWKKGRKAIQLSLKKNKK